MTQLMVCPNELPRRKRTGYQTFTKSISDAASRGEFAPKRLKAQDGFIPAMDKNAAEIIYGLFGASKKTVKKAIGAFYKKRLITIERNGIRLIEK